MPDQRQKTWTPSWAVGAQTIRTVSLVNIVRTRIPTVVVHLSPTTRWFKVMPESWV